MDEDLKKLIESTAADTRRQFDSKIESATAEMGRLFDSKIDSATAEMGRQFDSKIESATAEMRRHFDVVAERMDSKIDTIAERVVACNERVDRLGNKIEQLATDMANGFNDVRSMIRFSHHELDRRLRTLEEIVSELQARVERLESTTH